MQNGRGLFDSVRFTLSAHDGWRNMLKSPVYIYIYIYIYIHTSLSHAVCIFLHLSCRIKMHPHYSRAHCSSMPRCIALRIHCSRVAHAAPLLSSPLFSSPLRSPSASDSPHQYSRLLATRKRWTSLGHLVKFTRVLVLVLVLPQSCSHARFTLARRFFAVKFLLVANSSTKIGKRKFSESQALMFQPLFTRFVRVDRLFRPSVESPKMRNERMSWIVLSMATRSRLLV